MKRYCLLYNPVAGKGKINTNLGDIVSLLSKNNIEATCFASSKPGQIKEKAYHFDNDYYDVLLVCGGDGSLDEAISGLMLRKDYSDIKLAYIPAGTTNDFANSLGIPFDSIKASKMIVKEKSLMCDIGRLNDDYFAYVAAFGMLTDIAYSTPQDSKNILGYTAYMLQGASELLKFNQIKPVHLQVECQQRKLEGDYAIGMITNSRFVGGFKGITGKNVDLSDGLFEVTMIRMPNNLAQLPKIIANILSQDYSSEFVDHFQTSSLNIISTTPLKWTRDGEYGGEYTETNIVNIPRAINIITDQD